MKIFWSWQSDIEGDISRHFIKHCLKTAVDQLNEETTFDSRAEVDHDTKDIPGSPSITDTIFNKIKNCSVFVADITPVASTHNKKRNKKVMNPNVAIEIGYASALLGDDRIITIMNDSFGSIDDLPFNLKHKRGPITYSLKNGSSKNDITTEGKKLTYTFKGILKDYINVQSQRKINNVDLDINGPAIFFDPDKPLLRLSEGGFSLIKDKEYFFKKFSSYIYTKITPTAEFKFPKSELKKSMLVDSNFKVYPLFKLPDHTPEANKYGSIIVKFDKGAENLVSDFIQIFENGSIVSISNSFLYHYSNKINLVIFKKGLEKNLKESFALLAKLIKVEVEVEIEIGLVNGDNCSVMLPNPRDKTRYYLEPQRGPLENENYILKKVSKLNDMGKVEEIVKEFILYLLNDIGIEFNYDEHSWN